jgi:hypothetical protein
MRCSVCHQPFAGHGVALNGKLVRIVCVACYRKQFPAGQPMPRGNQNPGLFDIAGQYVPPRPIGGAPGPEADPGLGFGPNEHEAVDALELPRALGCRGYGIRHERGGRHGGSVSVGKFDPATVPTNGKP